MTNDPTPLAVRILVVDDNADAALIVSLSLRMRGYDVQSAQSGERALVITHSWHPQVILLDISMPSMDGYETCRQLRVQPLGDRVVIVALTGYGQEDDRRRTQEAGFDGHLVKPVDLTSLPSLLTELLEQKKTDSELE